jgi:RNA polymerase sigma factor (sigma-70 family)
MEVSALRYSGGIGLHGRSPLLRLQSDERLITLVRRGNPAAFEVLVSRYQSRLLAFCRHLLGSREDAEDVLQEVLTAAFNAMIADDRPINVRPWLYRIARNRCLNHLRRVQPVGVDSMDIHLSDHGASTADKVHMAEEFRLLVDDIQQLPETQRTALVLREMDALSYDQIAEAMETTVPSVKSLLVRARLSLAEASEARLLSCEQVRIELAEVAEGLLPKASAPVRRHMRSCHRCSSFQAELKRTSKALAALLPLGPLALLKQLAFAHLGHSASAGAGSGASGAGAAGAGAGAASTGAAVGSGAAAGGAVVGLSGGSMVPLGFGAVATKAAAGLAAAALVTAGAVEVTHTSVPTHARYHAGTVTHVAAAPQTTAKSSSPVRVAAAPAHATHHHRAAHAVEAALVKPDPTKDTKAKAASTKAAATGTKSTDKTTATTTPATSTPPTPPGRTDVQSVPTVLTSSTSGTAPSGPGTQFTTGTATPGGSTDTTSTDSSTTTSTTSTTTTTDSTTTTGTSDPSTTTTTTPTPTSPPPPPPSGGVTPSSDGGTGTGDPATGGTNGSGDDSNSPPGTAGTSDSGSGTSDPPLLPGEPTAAG